MFEAAADGTPGVQVTPSQDCLLIGEACSGAAVPSPELEPRSPSDGSPASPTAEAVPKRKPSFGAP
jgi:hypothetical protein